MPAKFARASLAVLISVALGCQEMHTISKYDPLIRNDAHPSDAELAAGTQRLGPSQSGPSANDPAPNGPTPSVVHRVSYAPSDSSPAVAASDSGASSAVSVAAAPAKPSWLAASSSGPSGKPWNDLFVTRGQGPLRDAFISDRALMAAVVICAIVIPFAVHDSRQPNPPNP